MRILSIHRNHDASVTLYCDGKIEKFFKEERLSDKKLDNDSFLSV
jgi:predicted NodU family carbamoyl transferase